MIDIFLLSKANKNKDPNSSRVFSQPRLFENEFYKRYPYYRHPHYRYWQYPRRYYDNMNNGLNFSYNNPAFRSQSLHFIDEDKDLENSFAAKSMPNFNHVNLASELKLPSDEKTENIESSNEETPEKEKKEYPLKLPFMADEHVDGEINETKNIIVSSVLFFKK